MRKSWQELAQVLSKYCHWKYYKINIKYKSENNQKPHMRGENQRCKIVALLKSLKNIYVLILWIHIPESIFKSNKHIYKIRY